MAVQQGREAEPGVTGCVGKSGNQGSVNNVLLPWGGGGPVPDVCWRDSAVGHDPLAGGWCAATAAARDSTRLNFVIVPCNSLNIYFEGLLHVSFCFPCSVSVSVCGCRVADAQVGVLSAMQRSLCAL